MANAPPEKLNLITGAAAAIEHSRWANRLHYLAALTGVLVVILGLAIYFDKPAFVVSTFAWMIFFAATLTVVTPSAEQMTKMLAQVAATLNGCASLTGSVVSLRSPAPTPSAPSPSRSPGRAATPIKPSEK